MKLLKTPEWLAVGETIIYTNDLWLFDYFSFALIWAKPYELEIIREFSAFHKKVFDKKFY